METKLISVRHLQENGIDIVRLIAPDGLLYEYGKFPVLTDKTPLQSAVDALWSGFFRALDMRDKFGNLPISLDSNVPGALNAFDTEYKAEVIAARE